jgi:hypothetical protein
MPLLALSAKARLMVPVGAMDSRCELRRPWPRILSFSAAGRERAAFLREVGRRVVGRVAQALRDALRLVARGGGVVAQAQHHQRVAQPGEAQPHATLRVGLGQLRGQRPDGDVQHVVQHARGRLRDGGEGLVVEARGGLERVADEAGEVDGAQAAAAVGRKRLLAALPGDEAVEDDRVAVGLRRVVHGLDARKLDGVHLGDEALRLAQGLSLRPGGMLLALRRQREIDLAHELLARLAIDDQVVLRLACIVAKPVGPIGHGSGGRDPTQVDASQDAEVRQQDLHVLQQPSIDGRQPHRATLAGGRHVDGPIGLEQSLQISPHAGLAALPDDLGNGQLGRGTEAVSFQRSGQQRRANDDELPSRDGDLATHVGACARSLSGNHRVHDLAHLGGELPVVAPQVDDGRQLALAPVREMTVAGDQSQQQAQVRAALWSELALAGLHEKLVARLQVRQPHLASRRVEVVPGCGCDLVALGRADPEHLGSGGGLEGGSRRADHGAAIGVAQSAPIHGALQRCAVGLECQDRGQAMLGREARVSRHARIGRADRLAVAQIVVLVDAIEEQHARLGVVVGAAHHLVPQRAGAGLGVDPQAVGALEGAGGELVLAGAGAVDEVERGVVVDRLHEGVGDAHRDVEVGEVAFVLGVDEALDVGVVAAQHGHLRAAPAAGRFDGLAAAVEHAHVADRAGRAAARGADPGALRPDAREVVADAAAAAHGLGGLGERGVDARHAVLVLRDGVAHRLHEAVDQRGGELGAGRGIDAARGHEAALQRCQGAGDAGAHVVQVALVALGVLLEQDLDADVLRRQLAGGGGRRVVQAALEVGGHGVRGLGWRTPRRIVASRRASPGARCRGPRPWARRGRRRPA